MGARVCAPDRDAGRVVGAEERVGRQGMGRVAERLRSGSKAYIPGGEPRYLGQVDTSKLMRIALAQIAPKLLDGAQTLARICERVEEAAQNGADLVVFGEALLPGYPVWTGRTDGAQFDSPLQKELHARYLESAVDLEAGGLDELLAVARKHGIAVSLGMIERGADRGGHSLFCTSAFVDRDGVLQSTHRKLVPTYEERLSWAPGDGHGLVVHRMGEFRVGALNCWENWMPLPRAALYAEGENLHLAHWPGSERNTRPITPFLAREGRSYCASVSALIRHQDLPEDLQGWMNTTPGEVLCDGGSCLAGPDGAWILEPHVGVETVLYADLDVRVVYGERQNFDPAGHYSRPDVLRLHVDRRRPNGAFPDAPNFPIV